MGGLFDLEPIPEVRNFPPGEHAPRARRSDPETSKEAAVAATKNLTEKQNEVLGYIGAFGPISDEALVRRMSAADRAFIENRCTQSPSGIRTRRAELVAKGLVIHDGFGTTASGNKCRLWAAVK